MSKPDPEAPVATNDAPSPKEEVIGIIDQEPKEEAPLEAPSAEKAKGLAGASNALGFDLYAKLKSQAGNLTFSPASIAAALSMTYGGAAGETRAEMAKVLHLDPSQKEAGYELGASLGALTKTSPGMTLRIANRLFGERGFAFEPAFLQKTKAAFGAPLEPMDFRKATEASRVAINEWVAEQTERKIENLVPPNGIAADTRLVLVNAVYFLGKWQTPFTKSRTSPEPFHLDGGKTKPVPTMHETGHRLYGEIDGVKLLELGYRDSDFAMTFVLPDKAKGMSALEASLSERKLDEWVGALAHHYTRVSLPKFRIEPGAALTLGKMLRALGMPSAFDRGRADFTNMANPPNPEDRLSISDVFHKAFVQVDEEGTEAAAATAVAMRTMGAMMPDEIKEFRADRPFLFFLRHKPTNLVLFMGRVTEP